MKREEFLKKLFLMYPCSFNKDNMRLWLDAYKLVLPEQYDYESLFVKIIKEHNSTAYAPAPSLLIEWVKPYNPRM
jgi:hypothetical protein